MSFLKDYPQVKIIQKISKENKIDIYLVGGFLRDYILGMPKNDLDFAVSKNAIQLAKKFSCKIRGAFVLLDDGRGCARVVKKQKGRIFTFDFSDFRAKTFNSDLSHRDFTINTLFADLSQINTATDISCIIQDIKGGLKDIKAKKIKINSAKVFKEDPLRMMRAFSLRAVLGFKIDKKTSLQIKKDKKLINNVSNERIREELFKVLASDKAFIFIKEMYKLGLLEEIIPQIKVMFKCKQAGSYHHLDVWDHSLETIRQLDSIVNNAKDRELKEYLEEKLGGDRSRFALIKLAALLHDIGKPDTKKKMKDRLTFHGHENSGKYIVRSIAKMLKLSIRERYALEGMVKGHLRPGYLSNSKRPSDKALYRYFRDTKQEAVSISILSLSDQRATRGPLTTEYSQKHHKKICLELIKTYFRKQKEKPFVCLINGNDIIKKIKLKPSPIFSKILEEIAEQQVLGNLKTKKEALLLAKKISEK